MITSDNYFLGNNLFPTESPRSFLTYNLSWNSYFLAPQRVSSRLSSKSIFPFKSPIDFLGCHVNNIPLTTSSKNIQRRNHFSTELIHISYFPPRKLFLWPSRPACHLWTVKILSLVVSQLVKSIITSELTDNQVLSFSPARTFLYRYVQFVTSEWQGSESSNSQ